MVFIKELYDYCVKVNWDKVNIEKYASDLGLTYDELIENALDYAYIYVDKDVYDEIIKKLKRVNYEFIELDELNPVLLEIFGVKTYRIWTNEKEKKIVLKSIYEMWNENNRNIKEITEKFGISRENVFNLLKMYAMLYLDLSESEWTRKIMEVKIVEKYGNNTATNKLVPIYEALINAKSLEDICEVIESSGYNTTYLRSHLHDYLIRYNRENYDEYMNSICNKFRMYSANKMQLKRKKTAEARMEARRKSDEEMLRMANEFVNKFINSPCANLEEFFKLVEYKGLCGLSIFEMFGRCLTLVKDNNPELYQKYEEKLEFENKKYYEAHIDELLTIISLLRNGFEEDRIKRNFDIIDYFQITTLSFDDIKKLIKIAHQNKDISAEDYGLIAKFIGYNKDSEIEKDIATIYNETRIVNVIRNSEAGVSNTLETIQDETKDKLIKYLRDNNVPVNYQNYGVALTRYKMGYITFEDSKSY